MLFFQSHDLLLSQVVHSFALSSRRRKYSASPNLLVSAGYKFKLPEDLGRSNKKCPHRLGALSRWGLGAPGEVMKGIIEDLAQLNT